MDNPLDAMYAFAEQAYIRMQAGDILLRCMEQSSLEPMQELVESLVLAGPQSLSAMSEVLSETGQRRTQVQDDLQRTYGEFQNKMKEHGVRLTDAAPDALAFMQLSALRFRNLLRSQGLQEHPAQEECMQRYRETRAMMTRLKAHLQLLQDLEAYLWDWLWGLAHESIWSVPRSFHQRPPDAAPL